MSPKGKRGSRRRAHNWNHALFTRDIYTASHSGYFLGRLRCYKHTFQVSQNLKKCIFLRSQVERIILSFSLLLIISSMIQTFKIESGSDFVFNKWATR